MDGTSYFEVYKRAITEFKDPTIKILFETDTIMFSQVMYNFLQNAISMFTNPLGAKKRVNDRIEPFLYTNSFIGDGVTDAFVLQNTPPSEQYTDCLFLYTVNGEPVIGTYDEATSTLTLNTAPLDGDIVEADIYYVGNWNIVLYDEESYILSQFIMSAWSEYIQNDKLDIIRLLGDTDFKLTAVSTTTTSKVGWYVVNRETVIKKMNKYAWDSSMERIY